MSDALEKALDGLTFASESMSWTRNERDEAILLALAAGATYKQLADAAYMTTEGIKKAIARMSANTVDNSVVDDVSSET